MEELKFKQEKNKVSELLKRKDLKFIAFKNNKTGIFNLYDSDSIKIYEKAIVSKDFIRNKGWKTDTLISDFLTNDYIVASEEENESINAEFDTKENMFWANNNYSALFQSDNYFITYDGGIGLLSVFSFYPKGLYKFEGYNENNFTNVFKGYGIYLKKMEKETV